MRRNQLFFDNQYQFDGTPIQIKKEDTFLYKSLPFSEQYITLNNTIIFPSIKIYKNVW